MFVLNRNGRTLYPNQLIMMNAVMSDILNNQRGYINGSNNNSKILETQSIVAGLFESDTPVTKEVNLDLTGYSNIEKGKPVTKEMLEKNLSLFKNLEKSLKIINSNLQIQMNDLDPVADEEILKILNLFKSVFEELSDIYKIIKNNKFLLSDIYLNKVNEILIQLFNGLSTLTSSTV